MEGGIPKFTTLTGVAAPLPMNNVDTDMIIPAVYLKAVERKGISKGLFSNLRRKPDGTPIPFVLDQPAYQKASILVAGENFGCGSSREHAPWALEDFGFKVIIASSYADIFYNNCFKNGMLPIVLSADIVDSLFKQVAATPYYKLQVDLAAQTVSTPSGESFSFSVDAFRKHCLLNGLDDIGLTMQHQDKIKAFEARHQQAQPWLYN